MTHNSLQCGDSKQEPPTTTPPVNERQPTTSSASTNSGKGSRFQHLFANPADADGRDAPRTVAPNSRPAAPADASTVFDADAGRRLLESLRRGDERLRDPAVVKAQESATRG